MTRIAWATDLHLEFTEASDRQRFYEQVARADIAAILVSGDTGTAQHVLTWLKQLRHYIGCPVLFVLGNHDFYYGSIAEVRGAAAAIAAGAEEPLYLSYASPVFLTPGVCVVGHDGWGDARLGDYERSCLQLNDFRLIRELALQESREHLKATLQTLGDEAAQHFGEVLPKALSMAQQVIVVTHVPPFQEVCFHKGEPSDFNGLPFFACGAAGETILRVAEQFPDRHILVLCGHTHAAAEARVAPNVLAIAGAAEYGRPAIQRVFTLPKTSQGGIS